MAENKTEESTYLELDILLDISTSAKETYERFHAKLEENLQQCINKFGQQNESRSIDNDIFWIYATRITNVLKNIESDFEISLQQQQTIRKSLQLLIHFGILPNLIPKIADKIMLNNKPNYIDYVMNSSENNNHTILVEKKYKKLCAAVHSFVALCGNCEINRIITAHFMNALLCGLYQLCYAPLKQPHSKITGNSVNNSVEFIMTEEFYCTILKDRIVFKEILNKLLSKTDQVLIFKELIILQEIRTTPIPAFLRRELSNELERRLTDSNGLMHFMRAIIDSSNFDVGENWRQVEIISKLIVIKPRNVEENDYFANLTSQIFKMLEVGISNNDSVCLIVASACIRSFYDSWTNDKFSQKILTLLFKPFIMLSEQKGDTSLNISNIFEKTNLYTKCVSTCFLRFNQTILPIKLLTPIIYILYKWCQACEHILKEEFSTLYKILVKYFSNSSNGTELFGLFIYEEPTTNFVLVDSRIIDALFNNYKSDIDISADKNLIIRLFKSVKTKNLLYNLFLYLLKDFCEHTTSHRNEKHLHRNLICIQLLSELTDDEDVRIKVLADPSKIVEFVSTMISIKVNCNSELEYSQISSDNLLMCLTMLSTVFRQVRDLNRDTSCFDALYIQLDALRKMNNIDKDIKHWAENILGNLRKPESNIESCENSYNKNISEAPISRCTDALNHICDPLLPIRAHGLIEISKLAKEKDEELIAQKYYIICILQEQLKHEDTYIFLPAINAFTSMATICPEIVIETLTQGYLKEGQKLSDGVEFTPEHRMKIGEALMKIIKESGTALSEYKTNFLNTFLMGARDDDFLIKASSLSNLGELCRVLTYDLGKEVVLQVLNLVENIVNTEKSPEVRRAAVLICTQLLRGIRDGKPGLVAGLKLLKPSQTMLINALKTAYENDSDETVRLHAQVAVEEICEIFKEVMMIQNNTL